LTQFFVVFERIFSMAVKIRLSRIGKTNRPYWRIVAVDARRKRDGAFLENLGTYDPIKHELVQFHTDKLEAWVAQGAVCTPAVLKLIKRST
jgi:small subunit ribosomal protein S16